MRKLALFLGALLLVIAGVLLMLTPSAHAQSVPSIGFDAVSIKQNHSGSGPMMIISPMDSDRILVRNASARAIVGEAYGIRLHDLIMGMPAWGDAEAYDMDASVAAADLTAFHKLLPMLRNPMLRAVLADRFHLISHLETRVLPAYALVVTKAGAKMKQVEPGILANGLKDPGGIDTNGNQITATGASMLPLLYVLQTRLGRPVVDRTGLAGNYTFTLKFAPVQSAAGSDADSGAPSIFTAVEEQLGLKLEAVKAPIEVLVVDHIERPTQN